MFGGSGWSVSSSPSEITRGSFPLYPVMGSSFSRPARDLLCRVSEHLGRVRAIYKKHKHMEDDKLTSMKLFLLSSEHAHRSDLTKRKTLACNLPFAEQRRALT